MAFIRKKRYAKRKRTTKRSSKYKRKSKFRSTRRASGRFGSYGRGRSSVQQYARRKPFQRVYKINPYRAPTKSLARRAHEAITGDGRVGQFLDWFGGLNPANAISPTQAMSIVNAMTGQQLITA